MSERVIAKRPPWYEPNQPPTSREWVPDKDAPSVETIAETLRKARGALRQDRHGDAVHAQVTAVLDHLEDT